MYLSDQDIKDAVDRGDLILSSSAIIGPSSIDLHLDSIEEARIWDAEAFKKHNRDHGIGELELRISKIRYGEISRLYHRKPPDDESSLVFQRGKDIIVKPGGFLLWQTKERVGTPFTNPKYMCFVDGKSTRARTGLVVHLTAPTIHAGWNGQITLEIANFGPFHVVLQEDDVIAQLTVAALKSPPAKTQSDAGSVTLGQKNVAGTSS